MSRPPGALAFADGRPGASWLARADALHAREPAILAEPLRGIAAAAFAGSFLVLVADLLLADWPRAAAMGLMLIASGVTLALCRAGRAGLGALVLLHGLALMFTARIVLGNGLRDFASAGYPAVLFLGCVFLRSRAYWQLAAVVLGSALAAGVAQVTSGATYVTPSVGPAGVASLLVLLTACAVGGRSLMRAIRSAAKRERALTSELAHTQERLEKFFNSSQNAVVVSRLEDGLHLEVNDAYLRMFGHSRDAVIGRATRDLGIWEDRRERDRLLRDVRKHGGVREFETRLRRRSGEILEALLSAELLNVEGQELLLVSVADITAQREAERRANYLATRDSLTGLPSRPLALDRLQRGIEQARRAGSAIGILHIGIDRFRALSQSLGRGAADDLMREVSARISATLRAGDTLASLSGDDLLYIADPMRDPSDAPRVVAKIMSAFEQPFTTASGPLALGASVGVSVYPDDGADAERLLGHAETAMHAAMHEGRGTHCLYDSVMGERARDRLLIETGLREGIARGELRLAYQPKFEIASGEITGLEALVRWSHPELGEIPPSRFISVAEESDLILVLGGWVLEEACAQIARWREEGANLVPVAVNLSARQLNNRLPGIVADCVNAHGVDPSLLQLEVTESMLITQPEATRRVLNQLSSRGFRIVLDDFGVGYSSLAYLKHLPLDGIKIDRSFVSEIALDRNDAAIVSAVVELAHGLGFSVVAEGIESEAQLEALRAVGCDEGQGFLLGRPSGPDAVAGGLLA